MEDVFLGYKREDISRAQEIAEGLRAEGLTVFFDVAVPVGDHWDDVLEQRVEGAKAVVVLWSEHSRNSVHVRGEAHTALELRKLTPARIDDCKIPMTFRTVQTADLRTWKLGDFTNREWRRLVASITTLLAKAERAAKFTSMAAILASNDNTDHPLELPPHDLLLELRSSTRQFAAPAQSQLAELRNAAQKGEVWAQYVLGLLHLFGDQVEQSPELALTWFLRAAERGWSGAYYALGVMLELSIGVQRNLRAALVAYERASAADHTMAREGAQRLMFIREHVA
jgi:hypothetical protein